MVRNSSTTVAAPGSDGWGFSFVRNQAPGCFLFNFCADCIGKQYRFWSPRGGVEPQVDLIERGY